MECFSIPSGCFLPLPNRDVYCAGSFGNSRALAKTNRTIESGLECRVGNGIKQGDIAEDDLAEHVIAFERP